jgi:hypothetical protein
VSIQGFIYQFRPNSKLVDPSTGIPIADGIDALNALFNRTGKGTGIIPIVSGPLVAAGVDQSSALGLSNDWNYVATVTAGSGVQILPLKPGNDIEVFNAGANALNVYPPTGSQIDALGINAPYVLNPGKLRIFQCWQIALFISLGN